MLSERIKLELRRFAALFASNEINYPVNCYLWIITLKYGADKGIGMTDISDFEKYNKVSKFFLDPEQYEYPENEIVFVESRLSRYVGEEYALFQKGIHRFIYSDFLNNIDIEYIPGWNLSNFDGEPRETELMRIVESVNILSSMYYSRRFLSATAYALYNLASNLLDVKSRDSFVDYVAGNGISTFAITKGAAREYLLADIRYNPSAMLFSVLFGVKNIHVRKRDLGSSEIEFNIADKIFMDPPLGGGNLSEEFSLDNITTKDVTGCCILRAATSLKDNGLAVIATTGSYLTGTSVQVQKVREYIIEKHLLSAVISLPGSWYGSNVKTNLIVLSKNDNQEVTFIDASEYKINQAHDEYIEENGEIVTGEIARIFKNRANSSISNVVSYSDINIDTIAPTYYIKPVETFSLSVDEIDRELQNTYARIETLIKELSGK